MNVLKSLPSGSVLFRSHPQWRAEGICIGGSYRRGMGIACQRNHFKRVYFPDNLDAIASNDKSLYLQRWLVDWGRLGIVDDCFEFAAGLAGGSTVSDF